MDARVCVTIPRLTNAEAELITVQLVNNSAKQMARPRVIDLDRILDAGERVVIRDGASNLTLDAVAAEAGISKGSVIYDCKTKHELIKAIIERKVVTENEKIEQAVKALGGQRNAAVRGRIAAATSVMLEESQPVALQLCSALAQDEDLQTRIKESINQALSIIADTSEQPRTALLAFLALEGLRFLHLSGFHVWPDSELAELLGEIDALVTIPSDTTLPT